MEARVVLSRGEEWLAAHRDVPLDLLRAYLGIALFVRGWILIGDPARLDAVMGSVKWFWPLLISHYVAAAHISFGLMLAFGLLTRLAAVAQLPILLGAVFGVHLREGLMTPSQSLELSALVLFALAVIAVFGAGRLSLDHYLFAPKPPLPAGAEDAEAWSEPPPAVEDVPSSLRS